MRLEWLTHQYKWGCFSLAADTQVSDTAAESTMTQLSTCEETADVQKNASCKNYHPHHKRLCRDFIQDMFDTAAGNHNLQSGKMKCAVEVFIEFQLWVEPTRGSSGGWWDRARTAGGCRSRWTGGSQPGTSWALVGVWSGGRLSYSAASDAWRTDVKREQRRFSDFPWINIIEIFFDFAVELITVCPLQENCLFYAFKAGGVDVFCLEICFYMQYIYKRAEII